MSEPTTRHNQIMNLRVSDADLLTGLAARAFGVLPPRATTPETPQ